MLNKIVYSTTGTSSLIIISALLLNACNSMADRSQFYHPAEFEPVNSICFVWSEDYYEIIPRLIGIISNKDRVTVFTGANEEDTLSMHSTLASHGCNFNNVKYVAVNEKPDNIWIRDYGPVYLVNRRGEKQLVAFDYFWSNPGFIEDFAAQSGYRVIKSTFNSSGGSREVNGKGTLILCEAHELDVNHPRTKQEIENEMIEKLRQKKVIWLRKGIPQDDSFLSGPLYDSIYPKGVNGHVDEFCRFADANTILITGVTDQEAGRHPILEEAKRRLDENYEILKSATDQDGKKFNVVKVPMAPLIVTDRRSGPEGQLVTSVTSYMNFIISNSLIILPSYVSDNSTDQSMVDKEKAVVTIFNQVFPAREIIRVRADTINYFSGGFHCATINEPLVKN